MMTTIVQCCISSCRCRMAFIFALSCFSCYCWQVRTFNPLRSPPYGGYEAAFGVGDAAVRLELLVDQMFDLLVRDTFMPLTYRSCLYFCQVHVRQHVSSAPGRKQAAAAATASMATRRLVATTTTVTTVLPATIG